MLTSNLAYINILNLKVFLSQKALICTDLQSPLFHCYSLKDIWGLEVFSSSKLSALFQIKAVQLWRCQGIKVTRLSLYHKCYQLNSYSPISHFKSAFQKVESCMKVKLMSVCNEKYYNMPEGGQACTFTNKINAKMQALLMALVSVLPHYNHHHHTH